MGNIIIKSGSVGTTQTDLDKFLASKEELETPEKVEAEKKAAEEKAAIVPEPKAEDFESEEDFAVAHEEWTVAQQKPEPEEDDEEESEGAQPKSRTQKKIRKRIERATSDLKEKLRQAEERLAALEGKAPATEKEENPEPKREDFASDKEYMDARIKWGIDQGLKQQTEKDEKEAEEAAQKQILTNYWAQVEEAKEAHPDWEEVKASLGETRIHSAVQLAIMEKENGAEITYYLGKHPEYTRRLAAIRPLSAVMEVGSLAAKLKAGLKTGAPGTKAANSGTPQKPKPRLPAPVQPVSTAATASSLTARDIAIKKGSFKDFKAKRAAGQ